MLSKRKAQNAISPKESKNSSVDSVNLAPESLLPISESKSEPESEVSLFVFPESGEISCGRNFNHSPLLSPARMNSSSSDHEN
jgi:hypothetical protein